MNLSWIDWAIVAAVIGTLTVGVSLTRAYVRSVADFLAAGRTAGRYLLTVSQGIAMLGAITIVGNVEMNYVAGFSMTWWGLSTALVVLIITMSGWVIYRFRQSRALTLAQFFEERYSRRFRVFAGLIAFLSGIVNFGIFPSVGARFFIHFCGLPLSISILGLAVPTFPLVMIVLLGLALYFVFSGGQIAVMLADFAQGIFVNVAFMIIIIYFLGVFDWDRICAALATAPENASLINPFKTSHVDDFNFWYFLIGVIGVIYGTMSWQGTQAYNTSAKSAHEAKMGSVLSNWRVVPQNLLLPFLAIIIYTTLHHADFLGVANHVNAELAAVDSEAIKSQLRIPLVLSQLLPTGLLGLFAGLMLAASVTTDDTYLHSWGSIFIQDVIMPFRRRPFTPKQHLRVLRWSILGVATFAFCFSLLFQQSQYIFLFFAITGAIFAGGSGAVIIGGLYWKRGTTAAAWSALATGSTIAVGGIVVHQLVLDFPINGQMFWGIAMGASALVYVLVSLLGKREVHDLDKLLHRGAYAVAGESTVVTAAPARGLRVLGMGREFTRKDRLIYVLTYVWTLGWVAVFLVGTIYNLSHQVDDRVWQKFWLIYIYINLVVSCVVTVWFALGGLRDIRGMFKRLSTMERDPNDDGRVR